MNGCHYCDEFEPMWKKLKKTVNGVKMKKINKDDSPELLQKYSVNSFPSLILSGKNDYKKFERKRTIPNIKLFLKKNLL